MVGYGCVFSQVGLAWKPFLGMCVLCAQGVCVCVCVFLICVCAHVCLCEKIDGLVQCSEVWCCEFGVLWLFECYVCCLLFD